MAQQTATDPWADLANQATNPAPTTAAPAPTNADPWAALAQQSQNPAPTSSASASNDDPWASLANQATSLPKQTPPPDDGSLTGKAWNFLNTPLTQTLFDWNSHREGAGGIEAGVEYFASNLTTPLSVGLAIGTLGASSLESGLVAAGETVGESGLKTLAGKLGLSTLQAAGYVRKAKLAADLGFLTKYGYDLGTNTIPQAEAYWNDYQNATGQAKEDALNRLQQFGTETVLNAVGSALAVKGIAGDLEHIRETSPKGMALSQNPDYAKGAYGYQENNQVYSGQGRQIFNDGMKAITDENRRVAIGMNIEAGGDARVLERSAQRAEQNPATKDQAPIYRAAKQLTDKEIEVRDKIRRVLAGDQAYLRSLRMLPDDAGRPNYLPHVHDFEVLDPQTGKPVSKPGEQAGFLKKRLFDSYADSEAAGLKAVTKDAIRLAADYHEKVGNLIAKNGLGEDLAGGRTGDGAPLAAPGLSRGGYSTAPRDVPVDPNELAQLQKVPGRLERLLATRRIYEVAETPAQDVTIPSQGEAIVPWRPRPGNELPGEAPQEAQFVKGRTPAKKNYMWKQSDYVPTRLHVLRPLTAEEMQEPGQAIVPNEETPFPGTDIMQPGQRGYPGVGTGEQIPSVRVPVYVAPEVAAHLEGMLDDSQPDSTLIRTALKFSSGAKSILLSASPFHWVTILNRSLEAGLNPINSLKEIFAPKSIDYFNLSPAQQAAIRDGVVAGNTKPSFSGYMSEGNTPGHQALANKLPIIGGFNRQIEERLFGPTGWITSLKFDLYDKLKQEVANTNPNFTDEQAGRIAASQVNNKFGGLNYAVLARHANTQNALRAFLFAPDFLESSGRSVLDLANSHGSGVVKALVGFNVAHWLLTRAINQLVSGDTHPESGFQVKSADGKKEYGLRTTLGDFLHFAEDPRGFLLNRVNPTLVRVPDELVNGVDQQGHKVSKEQQFFDTLRQMTPIPIQALYPNQQITQPDPLDQLAKSAGIQSRKYFTPAETLAMQRASGRSEGGAPLEGNALAATQKRYQLEDALRTAIVAKDVQARAQAIKDIHQASTGANADISQKQAMAMIKAANEYPTHIMAVTARLSLNDAIDVYQKATLAEKKQIKPLIMGKIDNFNKAAASGGKTPKEIEETKAKIANFRQAIRTQNPSSQLIPSPLFTSPTVQAAAKPKRTLDDFAHAVTVAEGAKPELNNPGDLKENGQIAQYATREEGERKLRNQLKAMVTGKSNYYKPDMTLRQAGLIYSDGDPNWSKNVAKQLGVSEDTKLGDLML
jgi:hypothetical protein